MMFRLALSLLALANVSASAGAETSPVIAFETSVDSQRVVQYVQDASQCVANNELDAPIAREFLVLRNDPRDRDYYRKKLSSRLGCKNKDGPAIAIEFGGDMFRYGLANALVKKDYLDKPILDFGIAPAVNHFHPAPLDAAIANDTSRKTKKLREDYANAMQIYMYSLIGECLSRRAPSQVVDLLGVPVGSKREQEKLAALTPALIDCGKIKQDTTFSQSWMRGGIALSYYRLAFSMDPRPLPKERKTNA
jgi:hypothetical protein